MAQQKPTQFEISWQQKKNQETERKFSSSITNFHDMDGFVKSLQMSNDNLQRRKTIKKEKRRKKQKPQGIIPKSSQRKREMIKNSHHDH